MCWDRGGGDPKLWPSAATAGIIEEGFPTGLPTSWYTVLRAEEGDAHRLYCRATRVTVPDGLTSGSDLKRILLMIITATSEVTNYTRPRPGRRQGSPDPMH